MKTLAERMAEEDRRLEEATAALSKEDRDEIATREELARKREARERAEEQRRALDLARRLDAARERLGDDVPAQELSIKGSEHTFIIKSAGSAAYNLHMEGLSKIIAAEMDAGKTKTNRANVNRVYAVAAVEDWNGIADFSGATTNGHDLNEFLKAHPAIVSEIVMVADQLAKVVKERRKS
jgi:hypothetical protein